MDTNEQQQRYEALCAYVLGELPADERARIEHELAQSDELRAQRDELEATIGLVRGSLGNGEELSEEAAANVLARVAAFDGASVGGAAAGRPRFRFLRGGNLMKIAAGIVFVALGYTGWRALSEQGGAAPFTYDRLDGTTVARAERQEDLRKSESKALGQDLEKLAGALGYTSGAEEADAAPRERVTDAFRKKDEAAEELARRSEAVAAGRWQNAAAETAIKERRNQVEADKPALSTGLREAESALQAPETSAATVFSESRLGEGVLVDLAFEAGSKVGTYKGPGDSVPPGGAAGEPFVGYTASTPPARGVPASSAGSLQTATDDYFIGRAATVPSTTSAAPPAETRATEMLKALGYVGGAAPNDHAPGAVPASPGSSGPAAPPIAGAELRQRDLAAQAKQRRSSDVKNEVIGRHLTDLGYTSADELEDRDGADDYRLGLRGMDPEARRRHVELECQRILESCRRRPQEHPRDMYFRYWGDNPFEYAQLDPLSTFAVDVDTASYTLARNYLNKGMIPPKAQVRTEEFVNYFAPDVPAPLEETFAVRTELAPSRFGGDPNLWMLSVAVRGREVAETERKPLRLTFVVDTSGSMKQENRMELVKHALRLLLGKLDGNDALAIVAFSREARLILPMTPASQRGVIESAIFPLAPDGGTNAEAGLKMGYEVALAGHDEFATNRVVLLSDGVANIGQTDQDRINAEVASRRAKGIYLNTVGVGMGNHNDVFLEQLADKGDGLCNYIDSPEAARRALVENFTGQFEPIARDVKLQVEFDPSQVVRYRLLGYENRAIADADFRNDAVDAGEVNAGHQVVALYEIERISNLAADAPLATVRLRWKQPHGKTRSAFVSGGNVIPVELDATDKASESEYPVHAAQAKAFEGTSLGYRRSVIVAQFAELLRRSRHAREDSLDDLIAQAEALRAQMPGDVEFTELVALLQQSRAVILNSIPTCDELCRTIDEIRIRNLQVAQIQLLQQDHAIVGELEQQNRKLEQAIRDLLQQRIENEGR